MNKIRTIILVFVLLTASLFAQVTISPTSLFLDSKSRFQTVVILNGSNSPQEVKLDWKFGYPVADDAGSISMVYEDSVQEAAHSAAAWIRGFPKNFILEPGARQTVRVTVKAPRDLESGTYWSRLITTSNAISPPIGAADPTGITAQINFQFNQITSVFYKHGQVNTGLDILDTRTQVNEEKVSIFAKYLKKGNSPFLGTMAAKVYNAKGTLVKDEKIFVSIYFDGLRRLDFDSSELPKGEYNVDLSFSSGREDIPSGDVVPAETVTSRTSFIKL